VKRTVKVLAVDPGAHRIGYARVELELDEEARSARFRAIEFGTLLAQEPATRQTLFEMVVEADWVVVEEVRTRAPKERQHPEKERSLREAQRWYNRVLEWGRAGQKEVLVMPGFTGGANRRYYTTWKEAFVGVPMPTDLRIIREVEDLFGIPLIGEVDDLEVERAVIRELIDPAEALGMAVVAVRDEIAPGYKVHYRFDIEPVKGGKK